MPLNWSRIRWRRFSFKKNYPVLAMWLSWFASEQCYLCNQTQGKVFVPLAVIKVDRICMNRKKKGESVTAHDGTLENPTDCDKLRRTDVTRWVYRELTYIQFSLTHCQPPPLHHDHPLPPTKASTHLAFHLFVCLFIYLISSLGR